MCWAYRQSTGDSHPIIRFPMTKYEPSDLLPRNHRISTRISVGERTKITGIRSNVDHLMRLESADLSQIFVEDDGILV